MLNIGWRNDIDSIYEYAYIFHVGVSMKEIVDKDRRKNKHGIF